MLPWRASSPPLPLEGSLCRTIDYEFVRKVDGYTFCGE